MAAKKSIKELLNQVTNDWFERAGELSATREPIPDSEKLPVASPQRIQERLAALDGFAAASASMIAGIRHSLEADLLAIESVRTLDALTPAMLSFKSVITPTEEAKDQYLSSVYGLIENRLEASAKSPAMVEPPTVEYLARIFRTSLNIANSLGVEETKLERFTSRNGELLAKCELLNSNWHALNGPRPIVTVLPERPTPITTRLTLEDIHTGQPHLSRALPDRLPRAWHLWVRLEGISYDPNYTYRMFRNRLAYNQAEWVIVCGLKWSEQTRHLLKRWIQSVGFKGVTDEFKHRSGDVRIYKPEQLTFVPVEVLDQPGIYLRRCSTNGPIDEVKPTDMGLELCIVR